MTLLLLCMAMLSITFMVAFGIWWDGNAPFKVHFVTLIIVIITFISIILLITFYLIIKPRFISNFQKDNMDNATLRKRNDVSRHIATPIAILDGYKIIFANHMFLSQLGLSGMNELITDMPLTNLVHPSDHANLAKIIASLTDDYRKNEIFTLRLLYIDGTTIPVHMSLSSLSGLGRSNLGLLQFSSTPFYTPVTKSSSEQFDCHLIIDSIEQIVFQINVEQELIFLNSSWEQILDHTRKDSLNKPLLSFIHPEDVPLVQTRIDPLIRGKHNHCHLQIRVIAKNGASCWVELRATTTSSLKGTRSGIIGTLTDINLMKQIEFDSKSNKQFPLNMIITNLPIMIYRCKNNRNWSFEFASEGCFEVIGYPSYEIVKTPDFSYTQIIHPDDQSYVWEYIQQQILKEQKFKLIYRIITRSGKVKWVLEQGEGIYSSTGEILALEGFITEITTATDNSDQPLIKLQRLLTSSKNIHSNSNYYS